MFDTLLTDLHIYFDKEIIEALYKSLNETMQSDYYFLSEYFCHNQGDFYKSAKICICDSGMFGNHCRDKGIKYWRQGWTAFQVIFGLVFGILAIVMWFGFINKIKENITLKGKVIQLFITPKYLVLINLMWITTGIISK